ncbi:Zinc finger, MYND-type [Phaffia rhodozyma]|uniref:Zinc finger, MYND-type n=1 Tax=Phaffia rhodozyma TaxID=264483 RepID=A0A0F7SFT9_PHARH|nr:Zinc finger, MYND-type [Phaffia rhodozyma]
MRDSNHTFPTQNRACVCITSALYDRRALDTTSALPLLNSLTHLTYLTSTSPRIREILTLDGGLERLLHILRNSSIPRPLPPPPDLYGLSLHPAIPASTGLLSPDRAIAYRFSLAFQCVSNIGVRGSEAIRTRVVQAGVLDIVAQVLEIWLKSKGMSIEAGSSGTGAPAGSHVSSRRKPVIPPSSTTTNNNTTTSGLFESGHESRVARGTTDTASVPNASSSLTTAPTAGRTLDMAPSRYHTHSLQTSLITTSEQDLSSRAHHPRPSHHHHHHHHHHPTQVNQHVAPGDRQPSALTAPTSLYGASRSDHDLSNPIQPVASSSSYPSGATSMSMPSSFTNSGDEETSDVNEGESSGASPTTYAAVDSETGREDLEESEIMDVEMAFQLAVSDEETARLTAIASAALQRFSGDISFRAPVPGPGTISPMGEPSGSDNLAFRRSDQQVETESPTPRIFQGTLLPSGMTVEPIVGSISADSSRRPSPTRSLSNSANTSADSSPSIPSAATVIPIEPAGRVTTARHNTLRAPTRPPFNNQHSDVSSAGGSNVSTPMGTPTGTANRERSDTLIGRPTLAPRRRNRRERVATPGNESGTTGGEEEDADEADEGELVGDGAGARPIGQTGIDGAVGGAGAALEVGIVQEEDGATDIESGLVDGDMLNQNVDLQMGAPPGAPGAVTPRTAAEMTPRQPFLPMTDPQVGVGAAGVPGGNVGGATPLVRPTQALGGPHGGTLLGGVNLNPPGVSLAGSPIQNTIGGAQNMPGMTAPAVVALATAQATQRTLRDLSMETGPSTGSNEHCYRDDDVLLSLQLLAYLSKYPHVRQAFHRPREPFHANLSLKLAPGEAPLPMRPPLSFTPNIFSLVERFTFKPSATDPNTPILPEEIVYWAGVIMRNACRKDEGRGGIRQCANMSCGKWESSPRQFAKCRRCRKAKYCSKECQSKAWSEGHRFWCSQRGETGDRADPSQESSDPVSSRGDRHQGTIPPPPVQYHHPALHHQHAGGPEASPTVGLVHPRPPAHTRTRTRTNTNPTITLPSLRIPARTQGMDVDVDTAEADADIDPRTMPVPPTPRPQPIGRTDGPSLPGGHPSVPFARARTDGLDSPLSTSEPGNGSSTAASTTVPAAPTLSRFPLPQWGLDVAGGLFSRPEQPMRSSTLPADLGQRASHSSSSFVPPPTSTTAGSNQSSSSSNNPNINSRIRALPHITNASLTASSTSLFAHPANSTSNTGSVSNLSLTAASAGANSGSTSSTSAFSRAFHFVDRLGLGGNNPDRTSHVPGASADGVQGERGIEQTPFGQAPSAPQVHHRRLFFRGSNGPGGLGGELGGVSRTGHDSEMSG